MRAWAVLGAALLAAGEIFVACSNDAVAPLDGQPPADATFAEMASDSPRASADADAGRDATVEAADGDDDSSLLGCDASSNDPKNCGRCGHDCIGGGCEGGVCLPWAILDMPASDVASDNAQVYWVSGTLPGNVASCPRTGCDAGTILIANAPVPNKIAVDNNRLYYTTYIPDGGYLAACTKGGCDGGPTILSGGHVYPSWLVLDSENVNVFETPVVMNLVSNA